MVDMTLAMAERAVLAHLEKLEAEGMVMVDTLGTYAACQNRER